MKPASVDAPLLLIDPDALAHNWRLVRAACPDTTVGAVLKHDAYGLGMAHVAPVLWALGCRDYWVSTGDEALTLRSCLPGGGARIHVLDGLGGHSAREWAAQGFIPVLAGPHEIGRLLAEAPSQRLPVAIHLDTGLTRLGFDEDALSLLQTGSALWRHAEPCLWVTHLGRFHDPHALQCRQQRARFLDWTAGLPAAARSIATSSSVFCGPEWHFEHARVGSALWGVPTSVRARAPLRPVASLQAPVLRVAEVPAGIEVGYAGRYITPGARRIATIGLGYGDGLPFSLANRGQFIVDDRPAPIVGGVAMGMVALDVSDFAPGQVRAGQWVEVFGRRQSVEQLAAAAGVPPIVLLALAARLAPRRRLQALP